MVPPSGDLTYLANAGRAIYAGMAKSDPKAVWLLQSWPFMFQGRFWHQDRLKAFLDAVPNDHMLILDLFCDCKPVWNRTQGFYGKPWVWNFVYNFGNNTVLGGSCPLTRFNDLAAARKDPLGKNLRGVGMMMEGFDHNPLVFDIMFELPWRDGIELQSWVRDYSRFRYGKANAQAQAAWETLRTTAYGHGYGAWFSGHTPFEGHPEHCQRLSYHTQALFKAWRLLLAAAPELSGTKTFRHDLVNVARQALASQANDSYERTIAAFQKKDQATFTQASAEFLQRLHDVDELLATNDEFLLGKWLEDAKRWGETDAERATLEWNARRILTLWGPGEGISNYASKNWSGMLNGFYAKRWEIYFSHLRDSLQTGKPVNAHADIHKFEEDWCNAHETYPARPAGDSVAVARRLYDKYGPKTIANLALNKPTTCSSSLPGMDAELANDGIIDGTTFWGTEAAPGKDAWWQVDFEKPTTVGHVVVVGFYGDKRVYGFTLEGSLDGHTWAALTDRRDNKEVSTKDGYTCTFAPREIRYLRVNMTSNSANLGRHLVEVLAYER